MEFGEDYALRTFVYGDCLDEGLCSILEHICIIEYQAIAFAYRLFAIFLRLNFISLCFCHSISFAADFCFLLKLLFEHHLFVLIQIQLVNTFDSALVELFMGLKAILYIFLKSTLFSFFDYFISNQVFLYIFLPIFKVLYLSLKFINLIDTG